MNSQQAIDAALKEMKKTADKKEDKRPFWQRLLTSIKPYAKASGTTASDIKVTEVGITGGTDF